MKTIYVLDWYTNKNVIVKNVDEESLSKLKAWDKVVYNSIEQNGVNKLTVWTYLWHEIETDRQWKFERLLEWEDKEFFEEQQQFALEIFPLFKKLFRKNFPDSIPITARFHIYSDQIYFYFYSEERYIFTDFVKELRQELGKNIFLFQIWARDMIKMAPWADCIIWCNWLSLCCKSSRPLPSVEIENIVIQNLEWRDIEKLKWRCGKLKCSIMYELDLYVQEGKKFPQKWSYTEVVGCDTCWTVLSFNIMNNDVTIKTEDGYVIRIPLSQIKLAKQKTQEKVEEKE